MSNYKTVPNQKVITINKEQCDGKHLYAAINLDAMHWAAQNLDGNPFKLWIYFAKNQKDYHFALSSNDVKEFFGLKKDAYNRAIQVLQEKGYLVAENNNSNKYNFYEIPLEEKQLPVVAKTDNEKTAPCREKLQPVVVKTDNALLEKAIRNNTNNITENNTGCEASPHSTEDNSYKNEVVEIEYKREIKEKRSNSFPGRKEKELFHF